MPSYRDNTLGIVAMCASSLSFILSDTLMKYVTLTLPLGEAIFLRGIFATLAVGLVVAWSGEWRAWRDLVSLRMSVRLIGDLGATLFYMVALVHMPIANVTAVFQITPLAMTAGAALFLGEKVGRARWSAIAVGFIGVMIIVRPGLAGFDVWSFAVFAAVFFVTVRDISSARLSAKAPTMLVTLVTTVAATVLGLGLRPFEASIGNRIDWVVPDQPLIGLVFLNALCLLGGYIGLLYATRVAETSAIAPFRYTLLIWAFLFGVIVFGQYPDVPTLIGTAILVATGLYTYHRERLRRSSSSS